MKHPGVSVSDFLLSEQYHPQGLNTVGWIFLLLAAEHISTDKRRTYPSLATLPSHRLNGSKVGPHETLSGWHKLGDLDREVGTARGYFRVSQQMWQKAYVHWLL